MRLGQQAVGASVAMADHFRTKKKSVLLAWEGSICVMHVTCRGDPFTLHEPFFACLVTVHKKKKKDEETKELSLCVCVSVG